MRKRERKRRRRKEREEKEEEEIPGPGCCPWYTSSSSSFFSSSSFSFSVSVALSFHSFIPFFLLAVAPVYERKRKVRSKGKKLTFSRLSLVPCDSANSTRNSDLGPSEWDFESEFFITGTCASVIYARISFKTSRCSIFLWKC